MGLGLGVGVGEGPGRLVEWGQVGSPTVLAGHPAITHTARAIPGGDKERGLGGGGGRGGGVVGGGRRQRGGRRGWGWG